MRGFLRCRVRLHYHNAGAFHTPDSGAGRFRQAFLIDIPEETRAITIAKNTASKVSRIVVRIFQIHRGHSKNNDLLFEVLIHNDVINRMRRFILRNLAPTLTCLPVRAVFFSKTNNMLPIKVACNGKNDVVRSITAFPIVTHLFNAHITNAFS